MPQKGSLSFSNIFVLVTSLVVCVASVYLSIKTSHKLESIELTGEPLIERQVKQVEKIETVVGLWTSAIHFAIQSDSPIKLNIDEEKFNDDVKELTGNHNELSEYMNEWSININTTSGYKDILKFIYSNNSEKLSLEVSEVQEKIFLRRKINDFSNSLTFYKQMIVLKNEQITSVKGTQEFLRSGLIFCSFISGVFFICFMIFLLQDFSLFSSRNDKFSILFVDDDKDILEVLSESSESLSRCIFFQAEDGFQAISVIKKEKIDLVVTDLSMPKMGGIELISKIKNKGIPIIVITSLDELSVEARTMLKGHIVYDKFEFLENIDKIIGHQVGLSIKDMNKNMAS